MIKIKSVIIFLLFLLAFFSLLSCGGNEPAETTPKVFTVCEHEPGEWIIDREPTLEDTGAAHVECIHCGFVLEFKSTPKLSLSKDELYEKLRQSLVKVLVNVDKNDDDYDFQGSGFFIDDKGTFVTNAHVIEGACSVFIVDSTGAEYEADMLIAYEYYEGSFYNDYALLRVSSYPNSVSVEFAGDAHPGDTAYTIGFPGGVDEPYIAEGEILNMTYHDCILSSCYTAPGSSGGILINTQGKVLGITSRIGYDADYNYIQYSVRYLMFVDALENDIHNAKSPFEFFYPDGIPEETTNLE